MRKEYRSQGRPSPPIIMAKRKSNILSILIVFCLNNLAMW
ncbi:hypothetical protein ASZ90_019158 [hydrocarbon metagenome]|uniref:Uncharacterized protein n=1 Tax=hydrocarbon metagenome TaxID=938273 RepID=A0A0W8E412_9ZZZZ